MRLGFLILLLLVIFAFGIVHGQTPKNISIDVYPRVSTTDPYNQKTFRVRVRVLRHKDNRLWSYSASCGSEIKSSEHELDEKSVITYEWYEEMTVIENCIFQACLHRVVGKEVKNYCSYQEITTDAIFDPPP